MERLTRLVLRHSHAIHQASPASPTGSRTLWTMHNGSLQVDLFINTFAVFAKFGQCACKHGGLLNLLSSLAAINRNMMGESRCFQALQAAFASVLGSLSVTHNSGLKPQRTRLRGVNLASFEVQLLDKGDLPVCDDAGAKPCLAVLCRRSDESTAVDSLFKPAAEFPAVLAAGGKGFFTQPSATQGVIHIVEDRLPLDEKHFAKAFDDLLAHELTHAGDSLLHQMDLRVCGMLACSEVRAAAQGECWDPPLLETRRGCTRRAARGSTDMAFPGAGREAVNAVFDVCYASPPTVNPTPMLPPMQ